MRQEGMVGGGEETKAKAEENGSYGDPRTGLETSAVGNGSNVRPRYYRCRQENGTPVYESRAYAPQRERKYESRAYAPQRERKEAREDEQAEKA